MVYQRCAMNEIERRWLVSSPPSLEGFDFGKIEQVYLTPKEGVKGIIRARRWIDGDLSAVGCYLTAKTAMTAMTNSEVEEMISEEMFEALKEHASRSINKTRYEIPLDDVLTVELDHFGGALWIAEIELPTEDYEFEVPEWFGEEITGNRDYSNYAMSVAI